MSEAIREAFENLALRKNWGIDRDAAGEYYMCVQSAWEAWQAALQNGEPVAYLTADGKHLVFADKADTPTSMTPLYTTPQPVVPEGSVILTLKDAKMLLINVVDQLRITKGGFDANRLASSNNALISAILDTEKRLSAGKENNNG